jgi:hypothetical protein
MNYLDHFFDHLKLPLNTEKTELAKQFGKYLLDKIGEEVYPEIEKSLIGVINKEQRGVPHVGDLMVEIAKIIKHPQFNSFHKFSEIFSGPMIEVRTVEMFNNEWTQAYKKILIEKLSNEASQVIFVNLLNPIIFKCIQKTLNVIVNENSINLEKSRHLKKLQELEECREVLCKAQSEHAYSQENQQIK